MEELWVQESDGTRRKAKKTKCSNCEQRFLQRVSGKKKFCSIKCSSQSRENQVEVLCSNCGNRFNKRPSAMNTKHGLHFCSRECKNHAQSLKGECEAIRPEHYGNGKTRHVAHRIIKQTKAPCCCGCQEDRRYLLIVHHIDGNASNNEISNLEIVCSNCHMKRHLRRTEDGWIYDPKALTPRDKLKSL